LPGVSVVIVLLAPLLGLIVSQPSVLSDFSGLGEFSPVSARPNESFVVCHNEDTIPLVYILSTNEKKEIGVFHFVHRADGTLADFLGKHVKRNRLKESVALLILESVPVNDNDTEEAEPLRNGVFFHDREIVSALYILSTYQPNVAVATVRSFPIPAFNQLVEINGVSAQNKHSPGSVSFAVAKTIIAIRLHVNRRIVIIPARKTIVDTGFKDKLAIVHYREILTPSNKMSSGPHHKSRLTSAPARNCFRYSWGPNWLRIWPS
jgi:hypothetical protein